MTSQTRHYIEVSDILALRCECKHCQAVLTLPLGKDVGKSLLLCPRCGKGWTRLENSTNEVLVSDFVNRVETLAAQMPHMGFALSLEIRGEAKP